MAALVWSGETPEGNVIDATVEGNSSKHVARIKAAVLVVFILTGIALFRFSPLKDYLTLEQLGALLDRSGYLAPLAFVGVFVAGACLFVPGSVLASLGAVLFGAVPGFVYAWVGAVLGAAAAFLIGRYLGRDFAASVIGDRLRKYDDLIAEKGFATVLYLRLLYFPYAPMNFGMGLTKVRFWDYLVASALGLTVSLFVITFFAGTIRDIWMHGQWEELVGWKALSGLGVFLASLFIPKMLNQFKDRQS